MARRKRLLVPEARKAMNQFKNQVMAEQGYFIDERNPDHVKY
ncbi:hypothetical protein BkAM31D_11920 [Halalkalibacter krulwichiae]|uniref:Uncharacterized protein n=1 Tax=Halalkalibacter krulwichiae TaxID=199441 RepID=A0A1X9MAP7_9BACI|nr:hypothetical protein BkAM31D_11920 [Halalkalibacter krulwichiae]